MFIIRQDGKEIVNTDHISAIETILGDQKTYDLNLMFSNGSHTILGSFKEQGRAKDVLVEICNSERRGQSYRVPEK